MGTASPRSSYRRRHWVVNRPLQFRFVRAMLFVLGVMAVGALLSVQVAIQLTLSTYELAHDALMVSLFNTVFWTIVLEFIVLAPLVAWLGILFSHKVAGPLVRIRATLAQMAKGQFDVHISLRKGDSLVELAEDINRLAAFLRSRS